MAGLDASTPLPEHIAVHQKSRYLEVRFNNGEVFELPFEFLRVYSPSAEVRGHGAGQETLQEGKRDVQILSVEGVGNYAIKPTFSDGHDSGLYSWDYLYAIGRDQETLWARYLERLQAEGASRDTPTLSTPKTGGGCGGPR